VPSSIEQLRDILNEAADIYERRDKQYGDQWKKYGWRGALYNARRKVERAWEQLWDHDPTVTLDDDPTDDLLDTINYCAMCIMEVRAGNRDGTGGWW